MKTVRLPHGQTFIPTLLCSSFYCSYVSTLHDVIPGINSWITYLIAYVSEIGWALRNSVGMVLGAPV